MSVKNKRVGLSWRLFVKSVTGHMYVDLDSEQKPNFLYAGMFETVFRYIGLRFIKVLLGKLV